MPEDQVKIKKQSSHSEGLTCCSDGDFYPYGTSLNFHDDLIDDLDISALAVGDVVEIRAYAFVDSKSEYTNSQRSNKDMGLQLTSIKVSRETDDRVKQLYGDS